MDLLFIIYIFVLFLIFVPNFLLTSKIDSSLLQSFVHAILFSVLFYLTYKYIKCEKKEHMTIGTYETNTDDKNYDIIVSGQPLVNLKSENKSELSDINDTRKVFETSTPSTSNNDELTNMPAYDYSKFRNYDYHSMKKKIELLENHGHRNKYADLEPNFNNTDHEILCAADYGKNTTCCRQPENYVPDNHVCGQLKPYCSNYIHNVQWGKCLANKPHSNPNIKSNQTKEFINAQIINGNNDNVEIERDTADGTYTVKQCPT